MTNRPELGRFVYRAAVAKAPVSRKNSRESDMPAGTNPKIEELRFKIKTDPKSLLFYPLAEELRKVGQFAEAEQVLRTGLTTHATYLSAWVVLGRVLKEQQKYTDAVGALNRALELDRGNVVAARLLAETYLAMGEKIEAIKKYKLVHALLPGDEDIEATIVRLEQELSPAAPASLPVAAPPEEAAFEAETSAAAPQEMPAAAPAAPLSIPKDDSEPSDVFDTTYSGLKRAHAREVATGDIEPMHAEHSESPFEDPPAGYSADAFAVEQPSGMHLAAAPFSAEVPEPFPPPSLPMETSPVAEQTDDADPFEPASEIAPGFIQGSFGANVPPPPAGADDFAKTITRADLYANPGLIDEARDIYEDVLARDPDNAVVRAKLEALENAQGGGEVRDDEAEEEAWPPPPPAETVPLRDDFSALSIAPGEPEPTPVSDDVSVSQAAAFNASEDRGPRTEDRAGGGKTEEQAAGGEGAKVDKLQNWLSKVKRPGVGSV